MAESNEVITTIAGFTDVGMVRSNNEDNFLIADLSTGRVFLIPQRITHKLADNRILLAVSDGVGGASCGEVASSIAVHSMRVELLRRSNTTTEPFDRLVQAVEKANTLIWNEGQSNPERKGMGATLTAALIEGNTAYIAEVGDSRGYVVHAGRIKQVTSDQSLVAVLVNKGLMTQEQAEKSPGRNIILQSLGSNAEVQVAVSSVELMVGDYMLLCSDGLSGKIKAEELLDFIKRSTSVEECCRDMIELAKQRGGEDNITVVLAKFEGPGLQSPKQVQQRLTTRIEILTDFDPEDENNYQNQRKRAAAQPPAKPKGDSGKLKDREDTAKLRDSDSHKTKRLSSEKVKGSMYMQTLGHSNVGEQALNVNDIAELSTLRITPTKYPKEKLLAANAQVQNGLAMTLTALRQQIEGLSHLALWAEKEGKNTSLLIESINRLEKLVEGIEKNKLPIDINQVVSEIAD